MSIKVSTFSLRLPLSLKAALERAASADGTSMNQFLVVAAAEKLASIQTAEEFFEARRGHGDVDAALRFLSRPGGDPPREGDELPENSQWGQLLEYGKRQATELGLEESDTDDLIGQHRGAVSSVKYREIDVLASATREVSVPQETAVRDRIRILHPEMPVESFLVKVNGRVVDYDYIIKDGETVTMTPVNVQGA